MRARRLVKSAVSLSLLAVVLLVLLSNSTGRPFVSYASSASMEPTIGAMDGFLVNPWPGALEVGDIIVFESVTRGGPAVHRIVAGSPEGWDTQGDANARPDQTLGEPRVTSERILGKVVTRNDGTPILLERLGVTVLELRAKLVVAENAVGGPRQLTALALLVVAGAAAVPAFLFRPHERPLPQRTPLRARVALRRLFPRGILGRHVGVALLLIVGASSIFAASHSANEVTSSLIVLQDPGAADDTVATGPGGELRREIEAGALLLLPTIIIVDADPDRVRAAEEPAILAPGADVTVGIWQRAGDRVGLQEDAVRLHRYPAFLPPSAMTSLHHAMPGSPYLLLGGLACALGGLWFARLRVATLPVANALRIPEDWL